ncbi:MAG: hypothetical protein ACQESD_02875 [Thermoplasmatota archaeon]
MNKESEEVEGKQVRGSVLKGFLKYIEKTWGKEGMEDFSIFTSINPDKIKEGLWYDADLLSKIHQWLFESKGKEALQRGGAHTVKSLGMLSYIVRFLHIERLLKRAPESYDEAFNYGTVDVNIQNNQAIVKMKNAVIDEYTCVAWKGVFEGALEVTKTKGAVEYFESKDKEDKDCYFIILW